VQEQQMQPACRPLTGFRFTLGTGIAGKPVTGPWGSLSVVSGPYRTDITTLASVPDRNGDGSITDGSTVAGAVTIELSAAQKAQALSSSLVLQGGTPTDPVLDRAQARVLLRVLRRAAADERHDHRHQARGEPGECHTGVHVRGQHLLYGGSHVPAGGQQRGRTRR
jgi:hypothetical protein